jgi:hypothetical protein
MCDYCLPVPRGPLLTGKKVETKPVLRAVGYVRFDPPPPEQVQFISDCLDKGMPWGSIQKAWDERQRARGLPEESEPPAERS